MKFSSTTSNKVESQQGESPIPVPVLYSMYRSEELGLYSTSWSRALCHGSSMRVIDGLYEFHRKWTASLPALGWLWNAIDIVIFTVVLYHPLLRRNQGVVYELGVKVIRKLITC